MLLSASSHKFSLANIKIVDLPSWLFLFTLFVIKGFDFSVSNNVSLLLLGIFFILSLFRLIYKEFHLKQIILFFLIFVIGIINYFFGGSEAFLFLGISLATTYGLNPKKILKFGFIILTSCLILSVLGSLIGIIDNEPFEIYREGQGIISRYAFGYTHPNAFHLNFFICSTLFLVVYSRKSNIIFIILLCLLDFIVYYFTKSRTGLIICLFSYLLFYLIKRFRTFRWIYTSFSPLILLIVVLVPFVLGFLYGKIDLVYKINDLLTGRIYYINYLISNFNVPLFGSTIYNEFVNFDSGFVTLLYQAGLFAFMIFLFMLFKTISLLLKRGEYSLIFLLTIFAIYGITEAFYQSITANISLFLFLYLFYYYNHGRNRKVKYVKRNNTIS